MSTLLTAAAAALRRGPGDEGGPQPTSIGHPATTIIQEHHHQPGYPTATNGGSAIPAMAQPGYPPAQHGYAPFGQPQYQQQNYGGGYPPQYGAAAPPPYGAAAPPPYGAAPGMGYNPYAPPTTGWRPDMGGGGGFGVDVQQPHDDFMANDGKTLLDDDADIAIRHGFVQKVYAILSIQLLVTFGICSIFNLVPAVRDWGRSNGWIMIVGMIIAIVPLFALTCFPSVARKHPGNMILLMILSVGFGLTLGVACAVVDTVSFLIAVGMTALVCVSLSLFACQTKIDFTGCGVFVFVTLIILMVFGIVAMFIRNKIVHLVYASLGALLFSFYLIYDTQQIVGGKHRKFQYSIDDYIFASLTLYMDIINLFTYILAIVAQSRNDS